MNFDLFLALQVVLADGSTILLFCDEAERRNRTTAPTAAGRMRSALNLGPLGCITFPLSVSYPVKEATEAS